MQEHVRPAAHKNSSTDDYLNLKALKKTCSFSVLSPFRSDSLGLCNQLKKGGLYEATAALPQ